MMPKIEQTTTNPKPLWKKVLCGGGAITALICLLLVVSYPVIQNRQNIKKLQQYGGMVEGIEKPVWMPESVSLWLIEKKIIYFHHVIGVRFAQKTVVYTKTPHKLGLEQLAGFAHLRVIVFSFLTVSEDELKHLGKLPNLTTLTFWGPTINDESLKHLRKAKKLTHLKLRGTEISDAGLTKYLSHHTKLESIFFEYNKTTDKGIEKLEKSLPKCDITNWTGEF